MPRSARYTKNGLFDSVAYQRDYRAQNGAKTAIWDLRRGLRSVSRHPEAVETALQMMKDFIAQHEQL